MGSKRDLTGVWHGIYTYTTQPHIPESHFLCVLIESGGRLSGTIHEEMNHFRGGATQENATVEGSHSAGAVSFNKTYDGSGKKTHSVSYSGHFDAIQDEIEGTWKIGGSSRSFTGRFLMTRRRSEELKYGKQVEENSAKEDMQAL
jgi:hypothetical protein